MKSIVVQQKWQHLWQRRRAVSVVYVVSWALFALVVVALVVVAVGGGGGVVVARMNGGIMV